MSWSDLWAYFDEATNEIKAYLWQQLDLENHLKGLSVKYQVEVLKSAPPDVLAIVNNCIYLETRMKLGIQQKPKNRMIRMVIR